MKGVEAAREEKLGGSVVVTDRSRWRPTTSPHCAGNGKFQWSSLDFGGLWWSHS